MTCGVCQESNTPDYVLKIETLLDDITTIFEQEFGMIGDDYLFPKVKTLGPRNKVGEVNPDNLIETYYSQLTREEVLGLYRLYYVDFQLFGYQADSYMQFAK